MIKDLLVTAKQQQDERLRRYGKTDTFDGYKQMQHCAHSSQQLPLPVLQLEH